MKDSTWFLLGDVIANLLAGVLAALFCWWFADVGDNMWVSMLWGMVLPMLLVMPMALILGRHFGALEIMLTTMATAMVVGMVVAMRGVMSKLMVIDALLYGVLIALLMVCWTIGLNAKLQAPSLRGGDRHDG